MQCEQFEQRLQRLLDERRRVEDDPRLQAHALVCDDCHQLLDLQQLLFRALEDTCPLEHEFAASPAQPVVAQVRRQQARDQLVFASVLAAGLLVMLASLLWWQDDPAAPTSPQWAPSVNADNLGAPAPQPPQTAERPAEPPDFVFGGATPFMLDWAPYFREPVDDLTGGLRPIASSISLAFYALRRTLPLGREHRVDRPASEQPGEGLLLLDDFPWHLG